MLSGVILWKLKIPSSAESLQISRPCSRQAETQKISVLSPVPLRKEIEKSPVSRKLFLQIGFV